MLRFWFIWITLAANAQSTTQIQAKSQWALRMVASSEAQNIKGNDEEILVAIIDTGGDISHPEIASRLWVNEGEVGLDAKGRDKSKNGMDDDRNGYIDDVHGWNFVDGSPDLKDHHGHGTHIGGIISQVAPHARLMFLKYYDPKSSQPSSMTGTVNAIRYATRMGAKIINFSAGGRVPYAAEKIAIANARDAGVLFVTAAGNEGLDTDIFPYYPASYRLSNILAVAAVGPSKRLLPISNFGKRTVHIAAPGDAIFSALPQSQHGNMTGTSQATAFATGAAALLLSRSHPRLAPEDCIARLVRTGDDDPISDPNGTSVLNAYRALAIKGRDTATTNVGMMDPSLFSPLKASAEDIQSTRLRKKSFD